MIGLALAGLISLSISFAQYVGRVVNPAIYSSPSGRYQLRINPDSPDAHDGASYRFSYDGKVLWEKPLPLSLQNAVVTDEGRFGGYAVHSVGKYENEFIVAMFSSKGELIGKTEEPVTPSNFMHMPDNPNPTGIFLDGRQERMVVRISDPEYIWRVEKWRVYSVSEGKLQETLAPFKADNHAFAIYFAKSIGRTPLQLVCWSMGGSPSKLAISLLDAKAKAVWSSTLGNEFSGLDTSSRAIQALGVDGTLLSVGDNRFEVLSAKSHRKFEYSVTQMRSGWKVTETSRSSYTPESRPRPAPFRDVQLKLVKQVRIRLDSAPTTNRLPGQGTANSGRKDGQHAIAALKVTVDGKVYALDKASGDLHAFGAEGQRLFIGKPALGDISSRPIGGEQVFGLAISPQVDGRILVDYDDYEAGRGEVIFDANGKRLGFQKAAEGWGGPPPKAFEPEWRWKGDDLLGRDGNVLTSIRRLPDDTWLGLIPKVAISPEGSLAVFDWGNPQDDEPMRIGFYTNTGQPESMAELDSRLENYCSFAYDGRFAYFAREKDLLVYDKKGHPVWRFVLPKRRGAKWDVFPSVRGVALFDGIDSVYWYSLPSERQQNP